jgi:hypothetical protein
MSSGEQPKWQLGGTTQELVEIHELVSQLAAMRISVDSLRGRLNAIKSRASQRFHDRKKARSGS